MPRLRILSDLHLEYAPWTFRPVGEDLVIFAGDIASSTRTGRARLQQLWTEVALTKVPALYVLGNHEGYGDRIPRDSLVADLRMSLPPTAHILERQAITLQGIRFLGCTLWSDFSLRENVGDLAQRLGAHEVGVRCEQEINDFTFLCPRKPGDSDTPIRAADMAQWHREERAWLNHAIAESREPVVVITHFLPSPESIHVRYRDNLLNAYFATDCRSLIRDPVRLWVHGHTHHACDYTSNGVRVVCNPRGYVQHGVRENKRFRGDFLVDVPVSPDPILPSTQPLSPG